MDKQTLLLMEFIAGIFGGKRSITSNVGEYRFDFQGKTIIVEDYFDHPKITFDYRDEDCLASISYFDHVNLDAGRRYCVLKRGHAGLHKSGGYDPDLRGGWYWDDADSDAEPDPIVVGKGRK